jgi:hypothetical protein
MRLAVEIWNFKMPTDWDLETWLLDAGEKAEGKRLAGGIESLTPAERLIREFWILDMETRNGGVSQYFCNRPAQWQSLRKAWLADEVPSLGSIIAEIDRVIAGANDPYLATLQGSPQLEEFYEAHQPRVLTELRRLVARGA